MCIIPDCVTIELLGGIRVFGTDGSDCTPSSLKCRLLLAYMCVPAGVRRTRGHLAEVLWPDRSIEQSSKSLRTTLSDLRRALGADAVVDELGEIALRDGTVRIDVDLIGSHDTPAAPIAMGEFLEGYEHDQDAFALWLDMHRDKLRSDCVAYALAQAERFQAQADPAQAKSMLLQAISIEPYSEALHRALIGLYIATGERGLALAQFRTCRDILRRELDVGPSLETIALADTISGKNAHPQSEVAGRAARLPETAVVPSALPATGLAVLPFANLGGDAEVGGVVDGIVEDIITDLSNVPELKITPRSAAMQFRGSDVAPSEKAAALNVRYLLEGSLRMNASRLRLNVHLIDTATNEQIWARRYDRDNADIFDIQMELAESIVTALRPHLQLPQLARRVERTTDNFEAYHLYLRGRELNRGMTRRSIEMARESFRNALELDPNYVKAMVGEAMAETTLAYQYKMGPKGYENAKATCEKVVRLQPDLPEVWLALAWIAALSEFSQDAYGLLDRALVLDPDFAEAHYYKGLITLTGSGDIEAVIASYSRSWDLDPGDLLNATNLSRALRSFGQKDQLELVEQSALSIAKRRIGQNPNDFEASYTLAILLGLREEREEATYWAEIATDIGKDDPRTAFFIAALCLCLGDVETAKRHFITLLMSNPPHARVMLFKNNPEFAALREDAEVQQAIETAMADAGPEVRNHR